MGGEEITVKFYVASWCGPSKVAQANLSKGVNFNYKIFDVEEYASQAYEDGVLCVPTAILPNNKKVVGYFPNTFDTIEKELSKYESSLSNT